MDQTIKPSTFNSLETDRLGIRFTAKFIHPLAGAVVLFDIINHSSLHNKHKMYDASLLYMCILSDNHPYFK